MRLERADRANAESRLIPPDQENPLGPCTSSASFRSGPEPREWHYGQRRMNSRTYRSDTWPHQPATAKLKNPLPTESRPYTAPLPSLNARVRNSRLWRFRFLAGRERRPIGILPDVTDWIRSDHSAIKWSSSPTPDHFRQPHIFDFWLPPHFAHAALQVHTDFELGRASRICQCRGPGHLRKASKDTARR